MDILGRSKIGNSGTWTVISNHLCEGARAGGGGYLMSKRRTLGSTLNSRTHQTFQWWTRIDICVLKARPCENTVHNSTAIWLWWSFQTEKEFKERKKVVPAKNDNQSIESFKDTIWYEMSNRSSIINANNHKILKPFENPSNQSCLFTYASKVGLSYVLYNQKYHMYYNAFFITIWWRQ